MAVVTFVFMILVFLLGLLFESFGLKLIAFAGVILSVYAILLVPYKWALFFTFLYIGLEGFFKVVSNYHPVVHVGSDIMVVALCFKVLLEIFFRGTQVRSLPPLANLFVVHFIWLAIVLFNPFSLSLIASIAGAKIYASMVLLYFFGYYLTNSAKDVRFYMLPFIIVAVLHTVTGLIQGFLGPDSLVALHPRYAVQLAKYRGTAFRPFGLTNLPGGPSVYMYQVFPFLLYYLFYLKSYLAKISILMFLPFSTFLFLLCQVRSALLKMIVASLLFIVGGIHIASKLSARLAQGLIASSALIAIALCIIVPQFMDASVEAQAENEAAIDRSLSLFDIDKVGGARRGAWDRFVIYAAEVPFGAGFSRVGAAAGAFKDLHHADKVFGYKHFFSDNFWLTTLVEIGIPGMIIMTLLLLALLYRGGRDYLRIKDPEIKVLQLAILSSLVAVFIGLYGAEGVLYNPEACFFWFFAGVLMKIPTFEKSRQN